MNDNKKEQILALARRTLDTEAQALRKMEETLGDSFVEAVESILANRGKLIAAANSPPRWLRPGLRASSSTPARPFTATWA